MLPIGKNNRLRPKGRLEDGFTLVELMVVLVIIGLMSSFVVFNLPASETSAQEDAEKIAAHFVAATREAVLSGETVGVTLTRSGYQFLRRRKGAWQSFEIVPSSVTHFWPEGGAVSLRLGGQRQVLPRAGTVRSAQAPFLVFAPTGESVPFELTLAKNGEIASVQSNYISQIKVGS